MPVLDDLRQEPEPKINKTTRGWPGPSMANFSLICDVVKLLYGTCQRILSHEQNLWFIAAKSVPGWRAVTRRNTCLPSAQSLRNAEIELWREPGRITDAKWLHKCLLTWKYRWDVVLTQKGSTLKKTEVNKNVDTWLRLGRWISGTVGQHLLVS